MHSHKVYVVTLVEDSRDVYVLNVYDGCLFTLNTIIVCLKDRLKDQKYQSTVSGDDAYIDVIDNNDELVKTYSIISKVAIFAD